MTGYMHECPVCGKEFWAYADWSYRKRNKAGQMKIYYCSWKCLRSLEREAELKKRNKAEEAERKIQLEKSRKMKKAIEELAKVNEDLQKVNRMIVNAAIRKGQI